MMYICSTRYSQQNLFNKTMELAWSLVFYMLLVTYVVSEDVPPLEGLKEAASEGELQYQMVAREATMPRYGECYQAAMKDLHIGCKELTDEVQSRVALSFTNCYVARFGWATYPCDKDQDLASCMSTLDNRAASIYSSMLTNTLAMCQFLQAQAWHKSTYDAVSNLRAASDAVSSQLTEAVDSATALRQQLNAQLVESRESLKEAFGEIKESTMEQRGLIVDVFDRLARLQALVMDEFTWFYAIVFYVSGVIVSMIATCTQRTLGARLPLLTLLGISLSIERSLAAWVLQTSETDALQTDIHAVIWVVRRCCVTLAVLILTREAVTYKDPAVLTAARLEALTAATSEIKSLIHEAPGVSSSLSGDTLKLLSNRFNDDISSDETYEPTDSDDAAEIELSWMDFETSQNRSGVGRYSLRALPTNDKTKSSANPLLSVESPEAFSRSVRRMELITCRRSRHLLRQLNQNNIKQEYSSEDEDLGVS